MNPPDTITYAQAGFIVAGLVPMFIGIRGGLVRIANTTWARRERFVFPLIWAGLAIWSAGVVFGIVTHVIWFSGAGFGLWCLIAIATVFLYWITARLHGRVLRGEIHDYDDERQHRDEHHDH